jgi:hypothetical protein
MADKKNQVVPAQKEQQQVVVADESALGKFDSRKVVNKLTDLMDQVTKEKVTAETVNAACNCATRITDILRLHLEAERLKPLRRR